MQPTPRLCGGMNRKTVDRTDNVAGAELGLVSGAAVNDVHDQRAVDNARCGRIDVFPPGDVCESDPVVVVRLAAWRPRFGLDRHLLDGDRARLLLSITEGLDSCLSARDERGTERQKRSGIGHLP